MILFVVGVSLIALPPPAGQNEHSSSPCTPKDAILPKQQCGVPDRACSSKMNKWNKIL
jgi:hypothetical protein